MVRYYPQYSSLSCEYLLFGWLLSAITMQYPRTFDLTRRVQQYGVGHKLLMNVLMEHLHMTVGKAVAIGDQFHTMGALMRAYSARTELEGATMLMNVRDYNNGSRIGFDLSYRVYFSVYANKDGNRVIETNPSPNIPPEWHF